MFFCKIIGIRACVGQNYAINIMYRLLAHFILNFEVYGEKSFKLNGKVTSDVDDSIEIGYKTGIVRHLHPTIPVILIPRQ